MASDTAQFLCLLCRGTALDFDDLRGAVVRVGQAVELTETTSHCLLHHGANQVLTALAKCANMVAPTLLNSSVLTRSQDILLVQHMLFQLRE